MPFADQLEHDRCGVGLGQAGDLEVVVRPHRRLPRDVAESGGEANGAVSVANEQDARPGRPRRRARRRPSAARLPRCSWPSSAWPSPMRRSQRPPSSKRALLPRPQASCHVRRSVFGVVSWSSCLRSVGLEQSRARRCADRERDDHEREPAEDRRLAALRAQRAILEARLFRPIAGRSAGRSCTTGLSGSSCITRVFIAAPLGVRAWLHARSSDRVSEDGKLVLRGPVFSRSRPTGCVRRAGRAGRRERVAIPSQLTEGRACRRSSRRAVRRRGA